MIISVCLDDYIVLFSRDKLLTILTSVWLLESCETEVSEVEAKCKIQVGMTEITWRVTLSPGWSRAQARLHRLHLIGYRQLY